MSDKSLNIETRPVKAAMSKEQMEQFVKENMTIVPKNQRNKFELLTLEQKVSKIHVYMDIKKVRELLFEKNKLENKVKELLIRRKATTEDVLRVIETCKKFIASRKEAEVKKLQLEIDKLTLLKRKLENN